MAVALTSLALGLVLPQTPPLQQQPATIRRARPVWARTQEGVTLARDIKGAAVWDLRVAGPDDVSDIASLSPLYPSSVVSTLVGGGNVVVGESGSSIISAALVAAGGDQSAELLAVICADGVDAESRRKAGLAALRRLKGAGCSEVVAACAADDKTSAELATSLGLTPGAATKADLQHFKALLAAINPDPGKKLKLA